MRYFYHILFCVACAIASGFFFGLLGFSATKELQTYEGDRNPNHTYSKSFTAPPVSIVDDLPVVTKEQPDDEALPSCSKVNTMPCTASPANPVKDALEATDSNDGIFKKGQDVTCIYQGVFWWDNKDEFVKAVPVVCKVIAASEVWNDLEPGYQHVQVDCTKDLDKNWITGNPGTGMVPNHKLNYKIRWMPSTDCYHFVQH